MERLVLDPRLPRGRAVEAALRQAITAGLLPAGTRLPSTRELAGELGVARGTVVVALDDLVAEGVLTARPRSGTFVARGAAPAPVAPAPAGPLAAPALDLRPGWPERGSFPTARWLSALRRAAAHAPTTALDDAGAWPLRVQLAAYLARARGVQTSPEQVVVTTGVRTACTLLATVFAELGAVRTAIEDPSLPSTTRPWTAVGGTVLDLAVDEDGAQVEQLTGAVDVALLTPSHQFPRGGALGPERRRAVCAWAARTGAWIVEDDYDGEFRFDRRPVPALQRSAPERVVHVGTVSKTLDPTLRLGWLALPPDLVRPVARAGQALTGGAPVLDQLALADLLATGDHERHVRRQRREYARRRTVLQEHLRAAGHEAPGIPAGLHAWIPVAHLPPASAEGVVHLGGVAAHSSARYARSLPTPPAVVAGFATPSRSTYERAVTTLVRHQPPAHAG